MTPSGSSSAVSEISSDGWWSMTVGAASTTSGLMSTISSSPPRSGPDPSCASLPSTDCDPSPSAVRSPGSMVWTSTSAVATGERGPPVETTRRSSDGPS